MNGMFIIEEDSRKNDLSKRKSWMFPRSIHIYDVMYQRVYMQDFKIGDNEWYVDLRITCRTCEKLYDIFKPYIEHKNTSYK